MGKGKALLAGSDRERCEALTFMTRWKLARGREQRCPFKATWKVQGKLLCRHHAVKEAVAICVERGQMARLSPPPQAGARVRTVHTP